ncbi:MAG: PhoH family protein [Myxococcota bacterium]|jgi:phosphate starvation-inducible PhoH-like protein|nr:PhoH family protein [Myxococcota bacterium]
MTIRETQRELPLPDGDLAPMVLGQGDELLRLLGRLTGTDLLVRGATVQLRGPQESVLLAERVLRQLILLARRGLPVSTADLQRAVGALDRDPTVSLEAILLDTVFTSDRGKPIRPKTPNQKHYVEAIRNHDIVFAIGPAGTGKTYLAMAMAVAAFMRREVQRIILARPAVEAGEKLGFLPGDLEEKVNPYLRPLYDALHDMVDIEKARRLVAHGQIEVAPLAFMRGRTLNSAFVVLDEAQNTTREQMKMFLTRLGNDSRAVVTGDITQVDLPAGAVSGLVDAQRTLDGVEGISFVRFGEEDVVRHPLVQAIVRAYERAEQAGRASPPHPGRPEAEEER